MTPPGTHSAGWVPQGVSVIVPAYNAAGTLRRALESALAQTRPPDEIVVADDGSSDGTAGVAEEMGVRLLRLDRSNGAVARNRAVDAASGELLLFLDADDWWHPEKVEAHVDAWADPSASFVFDWSFRVEGAEVVGPMGRGPAGPVAWEEFLDWTTWTGGSSFSVPAERYRALGGFREELVSQQDVDFWVRCGATFGPARRLNRALTYYRISPGGVSKVPRSVGENLERLLEGWPFASARQKRAFHRLVALTAAGFAPFPRSVPYLSLAGWPVHQSKFWRALARSIRAAA